MLTCGYARLRKHAVNTLQAIQDQGMTDPRQPDSIVAACVTEYRKRRPVDGLEVTDAMITARMQGPPPGYGDTVPEGAPDDAPVHEIAY
jgi:hypothetical protein